MRKWTAEMGDELARLCDLGWTASEIAKSMKTTRNAVIGRRHRSGLSSPLDGPPKPPRPRIPKPRPRPILQPSLPASIDGACRLIDLSNETCRWPVGDEIGVFCGKPEADMAGRCPYCREHARKARAWVASRR
jgi:GcrA cell cycle regulator